MHLDATLHVMVAELLRLPSLDESVARYKVADVPCLEKMDKMPYNPSVPPLAGAVMPWKKVEH